MKKKNKIKYIEPVNISLKRRLRRPISDGLYNKKLKFINLKILFLLFIKMTESYEEHQRRINRERQKRFYAANKDRIKEQKIKDRADLKKFKEYNTIKEDKSIIIKDNNMFIDEFNKYKIYNISEIEYRTAYPSIDIFGDIIEFDFKIEYKNLYFKYNTDKINEINNIMYYSSDPNFNDVFRYIVNTYNEIYNQIKFYNQIDKLKFIAENIIIPKYYEELQKTIIEEPNIKQNITTVVEEQKQENINDEIIKIDKPKKNKKKTIPLALKRNVWNKHIGESIGKALCQCCKLTEITQLNFSCGHIISEFNNGEVKLNNLKPICVSCNSSMGTKNMDEFILEFGL